jgi:probable phosphoglycerate mutase
MPLTAYLVRHGESQANVDHVFANRVDHPAALTDAGIGQARELAAMLADRSVSRIYASPLRRARETAEELATALGAPVTVTDALREYDTGDFEGLPYGDEHAWRWEEHGRVELAWREGNRHARHPGGESLDDIAARFLPFMRSLATTHTATDRLVLVGHGGLYMAALPLLFETLSMDDALRFGLRHCEAVIATWQDGHWTCRQWGEHRIMTGR